MKRAKAEIIQTSRAMSKYYFSVLEKQNDSGILFNQRIFFLLDRQHIGYISDTKSTEIPQNINFDKPKNTILLSNVKSIAINSAQLTLRFNLIEGNKKSERVWILRTEKEELARQWYDLLQRQKILVSSSQPLSPKKPQLPQPWTLSPKKEESGKKKQLTITRHLELSETSKVPKEKDKEFKEIGIGMSPKHNEQKKAEFKDPEEKLKEIIKEPPRKIEQKQPQKPPQKSPRALNKSVIQKQPEKAVQRSMEKAVSEEETLQQTSRREISDLGKSSSSNVRPTLVNTKYLINERPQKQDSRDYLQRTHELIKSLEPERSYRNTSISVLKQIQEQPSRTPNEEEKTLKLEKTQKWPKIPWTFKYVKYGYLIFRQFEIQTQSLMKELVLQQSRKRGEFAKFKPKLIKNGINYYDIGDIEVKMAFMGLEDIDTSSSDLQTQRVCNKRPVKALQNQFNNFKALYEYLGVQQKLRVPLASLCFHDGFVALFKVASKSLKKSIRFKQIQYQLSQLQKRSKIHCNFIQSLNNIIIQLDEGYYEQFREGEEDKTSFNLFFIQQIEEFLLPDLITDVPNDHVLLLRKELIDNYRIDAAPIKKDISFFKENTNKSGYSKQLQTFSKNILVALSDVIVQMDSFRAYFLNSKEFSNFLHAKGVNVRYLGHLYQNLKAQFQRRFVMTEMAARSCKALFRKTLQDLAASEDAPRDMDLHCKICDFLNCVLGSTFETAAIWKVLSTHSRAYFGLQLNFDQIDRGHFVIALIDNLKLEVVWDKVKAEEAFKSNIFFSQKNLIGLAIHSKSYPPIFATLYKNTVKILQREESFSGFDRLVAELQLKTQPIPEQLCMIEQQIRRYLSFFVSPAKSQEYPQLHLYDSCEGGRPSKAKFELLLMWIKWALRAGERQEYIRICDSFIRAATRYFGEFHPIFSELYELFSAYHLGSFEHEDAITFAKSSLVNMLRVCGSSHQRTAECYFHLALCYIRSGKREEGAAHIRKSLAILETNGRTQTHSYALMQLKLAMLLLSQGHPEQCVQRVHAAKSIFEARAGESPAGFEDETTQCMQILARCYQLLQWRAEAKQLLVHCEARLKKTTHSRNLQKILKVYLYPLLAGLTPEQASHYLDIISQLPVTADEASSEMAFGLLRARIAEESLLPCLRTYFGKLQSIEQHVREKGMLRGWLNFSEVYERETVKDFLALTVELLTFLGQGFLSGALREAL